MPAPKRNGKFQAPRYRTCLTRDSSTLLNTSLLPENPTGLFFPHPADSALFYRSGQNLVALYQQRCSTVLTHQEL